ncbi:pentapeptide repeat-containing protein [Streptomyces sp. IB201691-2A2]|uniref:pentapeptide repeat-containing protein n=1 Tax=Streptomyces sp. IB201691-2A2 TaxID=2561920 RepID=UPI00163D5873|nr:pentapeptide repeat-containing protein [Streptomyces sp. IB201691-2A2]
MLRTQWAMVVATTLPGLAAVIALIFTFVTVHQSQNSLNITEQGQITDRYNSAVTNLGSSSVDIRLGGIYALQRIMDDSSRDQPSIISLLSTFVRVHTHAKHSPAGVAQKPDIYAALSVLAYRDPAHDSQPRIDLHGVHLEGNNFYGLASYGRSGPDRVNFSGANLSDAHLAGAQLNTTNLSNALLSKADLTGSVLSNAVLDGAWLEQANLADADLGNAWLTNTLLSCADLRRADFGDATLTSADFTDTDLTGATFREVKARDADFYGAELTNASFTHADLTGASFANAHLTKTRFKGSQLAGAKLESASLAGADFTSTDITVKQVLSAYPERSTKLPAKIAADSRVQNRISEIDKWRRSTPPPVTWRKGCGEP